MTAVGSLDLDPCFDTGERVRLASPAAIARAAEVAAGTRHVVSRLSFAEAYVECSCGFKAEGKAQALAEAFAEHKRSIRLDL